ncbi:GPP34 family phosphoprotein [Streptomyces sp. NPDC007818]|uniref:GOLPH3/VPS74 family protein n=1 Tax=Streptomyces sp. NPDC007818 TaxID=3364780 RepID=UPI0036879011
MLTASGGPWRSSWRQTELGFATVGAALHELAAAGRITVSAGAVLARSAERCPDPVADLFLERLLLAERARRPRDWVERLGPELLGLARAELVAEGLLVPAERRVLGLFPVREYLRTGTGAEGACDERVAALLRAIGHPAPPSGPPAPGPDAVTDPITAAVATAMSAARYVLSFPG